MVLDRLWRHREQQPAAIVGECAGCEEDITTQEDYYSFTLGDKNNVLIHRNDDCCAKFVEANSYMRFTEK